MHLLVGLFVFFSIAFAQQVLQEDEEQTLNKVCKKSVIELAFSGNATIVVRNLATLMDPDANIKIMNTTYRFDQLRESLNQAPFSNILTVVDKPVLVKDNKCWIDVLSLAFLKNSDCVLGGRKLVAVEVVNDKIKNWDELFFPIDFSHVCEKRDLDKLPQDLFGNKKESDNVERGQSQDNVERGESRQNRSRG